MAEPISHFDITDGTWMAADGFVFDVTEFALSIKNTRGQFISNIYGIEAGSAV